MSSSLTYTFRNRRISPASSRKCALRSGNCRSSAENNSPKFAAEHLTCPVPDVSRRNAVGICTVTVISSLHRFRNTFLRSLQRSLQICFEVGELRPNRLLRFIFAGKHVGCLQTISRDAQYGCLLRRNTTLTIKFSRASGRHPTRGLGEDAFRLRQKLNGLDHFAIGNVFSPAPAFGDGLDGIVPIGRLANRQRSGQRRRLLRFNIGVSTLYCSRNRRTPSRLGPEKFHRFRLDQSQL